MKVFRGNEIKQFLIYFSPNVHFRNARQDGQEKLDQLIQCTDTVLYF